MYVCVCVGACVCVRVCMFVCVTDPTQQGNITQQVREMQTPQMVTNGCTAKGVEMATKSYEYHNTCAVARTHASGQCEGACNTFTRIQMSWQLCRCMQHFVVRTPKRGDRNLPTTQTPPCGTLWSASQKGTTEISRQHKRRKSRKWPRTATTKNCAVCCLGGKRCQSSIRRFLIGISCRGLHPGSRYSCPSRVPSQSLPC